jgi:tetratricopeptide (TPR) repeat protein
VYWLQERPLPTNVRDAHSLLLETLAELGPLGLALVLAIALVPLGAALRAKTTPLVPALAGAWAAYLAHASLDWDWEMPTLTLLGLACAGAIAGAPPGRIRVGNRTYAAAAAAALLLSILAAVSLLGHRSLAAADAALAAGELDRAEAHAHRADRLSFWSAEPTRLLAEAALARGHRAAAARRFRSALAREPRDWRLWYGLAAASGGQAAEHARVRARALNPLGA